MGERVPVRGRARTLVCLSSRVRHFEVFWPTFLRQVLTRLDAEVDLVGHFPPMETHADQAAVREELSNAVSRCRVEFAPDPPIAANRQKLDRHLAPQSHGIRGNLLQWHSLANVADLACSAARDWGPYDRIIWSRPDLLYINPIEEHLLCDAIVIPSAENWFGYHDRFCYGPPSLMIERLRILPYFLGRWYPEVARRPRPVPYRSLGRRRSGWNAEVVLRDFLDEELRLPVKRTDLLTARIRRVDREIFVLAPYHSPACLDAIPGSALRRAIDIIDRLGGAPGRVAPMIPLRLVVDSFPHLEHLAPLCT